MVSRCSRREFMGLTAAGAAGLAASPYSSWRAVAAESSEPDLVVFNAKVYTVDPLLPRAQAFAVKGGRFVAVGATEDMKSLVGKSTRTYDAQQMTIVPGFIDAHNHAPGERPALRSAGRRSLRSRIRQHRQHHRQAPQAGASERRPAPGLRAISSTTPRSRIKRALNIHDLDKVSTRASGGGPPPRRPYHATITARHSKSAGITRSRPSLRRPERSIATTRRTQWPRHR